MSLRDMVKSGPSGILALLVIVLLDAASYSVILPALPFVLMRFGVGPGVGGVLIASHAAATMIAAPTLGRLSDRLGRRNVILSSLIVTLSAYLGFAFAQSLWLLFAARIVAGLAAGNLSVVQAALSDATPKEARGRAMGFMTTAWGLGFLVGPIIAAWVPESRSTPALLPGLAAALLCVGGIGFLMLSKPSTTKYETNTIQVTSTPAFLQLRSLLVGQFGGAALCQAAVIAMAGFLAHDLYGWRQQELGILMAFVSGAIVVSQALVVPRLMLTFGDRLVARYALGAAAVTLGLVALEPGPLVFGAALAVAFCGIVSAQTAISTQLSKTATPLEQGRVMGTAGAAGAAGRVIGPALAGSVYVTFSHSTPFLLCGLLLMIVAAASFSRRSAGFSGSSP